MKNVEESKQNESKKPQVNKKELERLKKQVEDLKKAEKKKQQEILDCRYGKNKKIDILHKKSLEILLRAELEATIETLENKKLPLRFFELDLLNEACIGSLMMYFIIETIFCCYLIDVNPFDQPAVEEGKILTKKKLKFHEH